MREPTIYHGTPMTPRAALESVLPGRASCVSFYRPDDVEAVEGICPDIMFRQRRIFRMDGRDASRGGMVYPRGLGAVFSMAGVTDLSSRQVGSDTGRAGRTIPAQRCPNERLAFRPEGVTVMALLERRSEYRAPRSVVRKVWSGVCRMGRPSQKRTCRLSRLSTRYGTGVSPVWQPVAPYPYDAWGSSGVRLSVPIGGQHIARTEWSSL